MKWARWTVFAWVTLSAAACGGTEGLETAETGETEAALVRGVPCREVDIPGHNTVWCDDGQRCTAPANMDHGTIEQCHPEGWPPPTAVPKPR